MKSHLLGSICAFALRWSSRPANFFSAVAGTAALLIAFSILSISSAHAAVVYQYTGNNFESVDGIGGTPPHDTSMSVQVSFSVDSLLTNVSGDISAQVTSYTFFDGLTTLTEGNSVLGDFTVTTNGGGQITDWSLEAFNLDQADPTLQAGDLLIEIITRVDVDKANFYECGDTALGGGCTFFSWTFGAIVLDNPGSWSVVPIPPALYLFGSGILGLVGIARRKKAA